MIDIPKHKREQHEAIQTQIEEFYSKKKTVEKVEQGAVTTHSAKQFSVNNAAKLKLMEGNK